jgi:hypothetical protein
VTIITGRVNALPAVRPYIRIRYNRKQIDNAIAENRCGLLWCNGFSFLRQEYLS